MDVPLTEFNKSMIKYPTDRQQRLCHFEVGGIETLGEPIINWRQKFARLVPPSLIAPQSGEARGAAQSPGRGQKDRERHLQRVCPRSYSRHQHLPGVSEP